MNIKIKISCDNAAFVDMPEHEVARILRELADRLEERGLDDCKLRDINGNPVGTFEVKNESEEA